MLPINKKAQTINTHSNVEIEIFMGLDGLKSASSWQLYVWPLRGPSLFFAQSLLAQFHFSLSSHLNVLNQGTKLGRDQAETEDLFMLAIIEVERDQHKHFFFCLLKSLIFQTSHYLFWYVLSHFFFILGNQFYALIIYCQK